MNEDLNGKRYKSPLRKLVRFFEHSRDGWKATVGPPGKDPGAEPSPNAARVEAGFSRGDGLAGPRVSKRTLGGARLLSRRRGGGRPLPPPRRFGR